MVVCKIRDHLFDGWMQGWRWERAADVLGWNRPRLRFAHGWSELQDLGWCWEVLTRLHRRLHRLHELFAGQVSHRHPVEAARFG